MAGFAAALAAAAEVALCPVAPAPAPATGPILLKKKRRDPPLREGRKEPTGARSKEPPALARPDDDESAGLSGAVSEGGSAAYDELDVGWDLPSSVDRVPVSPY